MPGAEFPAEADGALELAGHWRRLVTGWMTHRAPESDIDAGACTLRFTVPDADWTGSVRFMATRRLLVAFLTDGRILRPDQLARAAAAANAWNVEQLTPMLAVWDVRGPSPCLAGTCVLPLGARMTPADFAALADEWIDQGGQMFTKCHQVFQF